MMMRVLAEPAVSAGSGSGATIGNRHGRHSMPRPSSRTISSMTVSASPHASSTEAMSPDSFGNSAPNMCMNAARQHSSNSLCWSS